MKIKFLYWAVYKNIEREILHLAELIHFDDNQLSVYSVRIADLLVRCVVEIESLIKELHRESKFLEVDTTGKMLDAINNAWKLDKKQIAIVALNMHFSERCSTFCPFNYKNKDSDDYYSAYNAVKHNRAGNFEKYATIHFLLRAMGALFLLNIYYRDETFPLYKTRTLSDNKMDSEIFAFEVKELNPKYPVKEETIHNDEVLKAMYLIKPTEDTYKQYFDEAERIFDKQKYELKQGGYTTPNNENEEDQDIDYSERFKIAASISVDMVNSISKLEESSTKKYGTLSFKATLNKKPTLIYYPKFEEKN
jgi:hypothetical protein